MWTILKNKNLFTFKSFETFGKRLIRAIGSGRHFGAMQQRCWRHSSMQENFFSNRFKSELSQCHATAVAAAAAAPDFIAAMIADDCCPFTHSLTNTHTRTCTHEHAHGNTNTHTRTRTRTCSNTAPYHHLSLVHCCHRIHLLWHILFSSHLWFFLSCFLLWWGLIWLSL